MPGITGFISKAKAQDQNTLDQMVGCMMHEPFYTSGTLIEKELGVAVGWVSHKGSFSDCLPIWNEQKNICLIFSGEHFVDKSDVKNIRQRGRECSENDARWLVRLYEEAGDKFFEKLNGTFSGVLIDAKQQKVILFNDRYGLNRVCCHEGVDGFYFASEAKSLLRVLPQLRQLDMAALGEFFSCGCGLQNRSLFSCINLLPGASKWTFRPQQAIEKKSYFEKADWENQSPLPDSEYYEKLNETFTRILPRYFQGKQKVGLSLTGGLDSRMIAAAASVPPESLPCHTFGGMYRECADVKLAKQIAKVCEQPHEIIPVTSKFFPEFPELARRSVYYTDGAMDVTGSVELFVNRKVRESVPVRLTGNYGSEILRKHIAFKAGSLLEPMFNGSFIPCYKKAGATYATERNVSKTSFIAFKQVPWFHFARLATEQSQLTLRSPFLDNELVALAFQAPTDPVINKTFAHRFISDHNTKLAAIPTDRGVVGRDGASGGKFSVFCQEFMPRVEYVFDYGMPQWFTKFNRVMSPFGIERLFLGRQKFYHFRTWYQNELSGYIKEMLLDRRSLSRPYLNGRQVENMIKAHTSGRGNYTLEIHKLLSSELIQRHLIEQS